MHRVAIKSKATNSSPLLQIHPRTQYLQRFFFLNSPFVDLRNVANFSSVKEHYITRSTSVSKLCEIGRIRAVGQISLDAQE